MLMRRAGLKEEQRTLILSQVGRNLSFDNVSEAMQLTFGQHSVLPAHKDKGKGIYYEEDEYWYEDYHHSYYEEDHEYYEYDEEDDTPFDQSESYYQHEAANRDEAIFNVDEFDDIYSNYLDACKLMNDLRLARGFYPIVAVAPQAASGYTSAPPKGAKGKGCGKKGGRGKGPSKGAGRKGKDR